MSLLSSLLHLHDDIYPYFFVTPDTMIPLLLTYNQTKPQVYLIVGKLQSNGGDGRRRMAIREWRSVKFCYCEYAGHNVSLEAEVVFPSELLPDQPPRVLSHRCSNSLECNLDGRTCCVWAGTNPVIDPFKEFVEAI